LEWAGNPAQLKSCSDWSGWGSPTGAIRHAIEHQQRVGEDARDRVGASHYSPTCRELANARAPARHAIGGGLADISHNPAGKNTVGQSTRDASDGRPDLRTNRPHPSR